LAVREEITDQFDLEIFREVFDRIESKSAETKSIEEPNCPIFDFITDLGVSHTGGGYHGMIVVDVGKHQVVVISKLSTNALGPIFVFSHNSKQFVAADWIILRSESREEILQCQRR
jgi:hypothetical protein